MMCLALSLSCQAHAYSILAQATKDINAPRWEIRRNAFERLATMPNSADNLGARSLLIKLRLIEDAQANAGDPAPDLFEDDDYLAYDEELTYIVEQIAVATNDKSAWKALVYQRYNGDSVHGNWISSHRECLPYLQQQLLSKYWPRRMNAVYVIAAMLAKSKKTGSISPIRYQQLKKKIRKLAIADVPSVRESAIEGLGLIKDREDIPLLRSLAEKSPDQGVRISARSAEIAIRQAIPTPPP